MVPCHSCYIYGTWRVKEVGGLNSSYGGKLNGGSYKVKGSGALFMGELTPQVFYQNYLPISTSFDLKRVPWYVLHNIRFR